MPEVYYGVLPDFTTGGMTFGCGTGTTFGNETLGLVARAGRGDHRSRSRPGHRASPRRSPGTTPPTARSATSATPSRPRRRGRRRHLCRAERVLERRQRCIVSRSVTSDFSVSVSPASLTVARGGRAARRRSARQPSTHPRPSHSLPAGLPSGVTASFNPAQCAPAELDVTLSRVVECDRWTLDGDGHPNRRVGWSTYPRHRLADGDDATKRLLGQRRRPASPSRGASARSRYTTAIDAPRDRLTRCQRASQRCDCASFNPAKCELRR